jgi:uncharacterized protein YndB with AHSA1/START domain
MDDRGATAMKEFEVRFEGDLPATPQEVWDAITAHTTGWYWTISYEPRVGGAERGLTSAGGTVTAWEPPRHFATRAERSDGWWNNLDYVLEPRGGGTFLDYTHTNALAEDAYDVELDACRRHTAFYYHSLGEYLRNFKGRDATYLAAHGPENSARSGAFAVLRRALGLADGAAAGDSVRLTPAGLEAIDGVVDYATPEFLGVRSADALYRFYGRDAWGWPVGVAHHLFAHGVDSERTGEAWRVWLDAVFDDGRSAA